MQIVYMLFERSECKSPNFHFIPSGLTPVIRSSVRKYGGTGFVLPFTNCSAGRCR